MPLDRWVALIVSVGSVIIAIDLWVHRQGRDISDNTRRLNEHDQELTAIRVMIDRANTTSSQKASETMAKMVALELTLKGLTTLEDERRRGRNR